MLVDAYCPLGTTFPNPDRRKLRTRKSGAPNRCSSDINADARTRHQDPLTERAHVFTDTLWDPCEARKAYPVRKLSAEEIAEIQKAVS